MDMSFFQVSDDNIALLNVEKFFLCQGKLCLHIYRSRKSIFDRDLMIGMSFLKRNIPLVENEKILRTI